MAPIAAVLASAINLAAQSRGLAVDFPGSGGTLTLFAVTLVYSGVLCVLGSIAGVLLAKRFRADRESSDARR